MKLVSLKTKTMPGPTELYGYVIFQRIWFFSCSGLESSLLIFGQK